MSVAVCTAACTTFIADQLHLLPVLISHAWVMAVTPCLSILHVQVSGIPAGASAGEVEELLTGPGGLVVDRVDLMTPQGATNREAMQVRRVGAGNGRQCHCGWKGGA